MVLSDDTPKSEEKINDPPELQVAKPASNPDEPPATKKRRTDDGEKRTQKGIDFSEARPEPPMDDVSCSLMLTNEPPSVSVSLHNSNFLQPLMREFIDIGWRSVKYRDQCSAAEGT